MSFWAQGTGATDWNIGHSDKTYSTGTACQALSSCTTTNTNTVTGTGTTWVTNGVTVGSTIVWGNGDVDTITGVNSETSLTVSRSTIETSQNYTIYINTDSPCSTGATIGTSWTQLTCTFTVGSTVGPVSSIYIRQTGSSSVPIYIDGVTLVQASSGLSFSNPAQNIQVDSALDNITLNGGQDANLQPWQLNTTTMPTPRRHASTVVANGYIYYVDGMMTGNPVNAINYAKLNADGSVGAWSSTVGGVSVYGAAVTVANGYMYIVGGCNDTSATASCSTNANNAISTVSYAPIKPDGSLGSFITNPYSLPANRGFASLAVMNGYLYVIGGSNGVQTNPAPQNTMYYAKLNADGSVYNSGVAGGWSTASNGPGAVYGQTSFVANGAIYVVGGCTDTTGGNSCSTPSSTVEYITTPNFGGSWTATTSLPKATGLHSSAVMNGNIYVLGGRSGGSPVSSVLYSKITSNGVANWYYTTSLPAVRQGAPATANNGYVYVLGGYDGSSLQSNVFYASGARTLVYGGLDLVGLSGQTLTDPSGGGTLTAGDTKIIGSLRVDDLATLNNGAAINGLVAIQSAGTSGMSTLVISNATNGATLLNVKDMSQNFGSYISGGSFEGKNSYFGEEFNVGHITGCSTSALASAGLVESFARGDIGGNASTATGCTSAAATIGAGELNVATVIGNAVVADNACNETSQNAANGVERIQAIIATAVAGDKAACAETLASNTAGTSNKIYTTTNLPVITAKVKVSAMTVNATNSVVVVGANIANNPNTDGTGVNLPNTGIFFTNCSTYTAGAPSGCSNTTWYGMVANGNALATGGAQTCSVGSGSLTGNFSYLRIEVRATNDIHFYADYNTADGIQESECGTGVTGASSTSAMAPWLEVKAIGNNVLTNQLDIDYFRSWQDDNTPIDSVSPDSDTTVNNTPVVTDAPVSPDSADPNVAGSFFNFLGATSEDTVVNGNLFVHGTIYADKIKANEIEGLSIFTDQISSLQAKLIAQQNSTSTSTGVSSGPFVVTVGDSTFNSVTINLDLKVLGNLFSSGTLTVNGDAHFAGNVSFAGHVITSGNTPDAALESGAGITLAPVDNPAANLATAQIDGNDISGQVNVTLGDGTSAGKLITVNFKKAYSKAPKVLITPNNANASAIQYYVQTTANGFTIVITGGTVSPANNLNFSYFVAE
jgi:hypothetical protein